MTPKHLIKIMSLMIMKNNSYKEDGITDRLVIQIMNNKTFLKNYFTSKLNNCNDDQWLSFYKNYLKLSKF